MFRSLRSKLMNRGSESVLADTSPFQPVHISTSEPVLPSSSKPAKLMSRDDERAANLHRKECGRFRILTIGRANAGKTTILQKVCNTTEKPVIYNSKGKKIKQSLLRPSAERGLHDIKNEMVFKSNPGFIFHDSRGFEAGGVAELENVKSFIADRAKSEELSDQVHAIWYCIPMDDSRPFTTAEINFFSEYGTGSVPVIVVFTKFDALEKKAYQTLLDENATWEEAKAQALQRAVEDFRPHLDGLYRRPYPPRGHVYLKDMYKADANCKELTERTAAVIDNETLLLLFVSTQQNNLGLCMKYAIERDLVRQIIAVGGSESSAGLSLKAQETICQWFPNFLGIIGWADAAWATRRTAHFISSSIVTSPDIQSSLKSFIGAPPAVLQATRLGIALIIILDYSYSLWYQHPSDGCLAAAISHYQKSPNCNAVVQAIDTTFNHNGVNISMDLVNNVGSRQGFEEKLFQIAMNHRLSYSK